MAARALGFAEAAPEIGQRLYFLDKGWRPVPDWSAFFVALGAAMASDAPGARLVAAVSTPTRAYAAALCAAGVVFERAKYPVTLDATAHLAYLRTLPLGTTVDYRHGASGANRSTGWLAGFEHHFGQDYIVIRDTPASTIKLLASKAHHVEPAAKPLLQLPQRRRARVVDTRLGLMIGMLGREGGYTFARDSRLECLLVGNKATLREEIVETNFAVERDGRWFRGYLQNLLRVRSFGEDGDGHRSEVVAVGATLPPTLNDASPAVAIFDGATSFLRWHTTWPDARWIVVLDRTDRRFSDAVASLDAMYATRRPGDHRPRSLAPPPGVEWSVLAMKWGGE